MELSSKAWVESMTVDIGYSEPWGKVVTAGTRLQHGFSNDFFLSVRIIEYRTCNLYLFISRINNVCKMFEEY